MSIGIKGFSTDQVENMKHNHSVREKDSLSPEELTTCINGCALNNRGSQKEIYNSFFGYAAAICLRYCNSYDDTVEVVNDGFLKIFKEIHRFKPAYTDVISSFKGWVKKIMMYTAIDHFRKNRKYQLTAELDSGHVQVSAPDENALDRISYEEIKRSVKRLTPGYRTVFNLFIMDGYTHEEISGRLGISIGTSKSNLAKARRQLQEILLHQNQVRIIGS